MIRRYFDTVAIGTSFAFALLMFTFGAAVAQTMPLFALVLVVVACGTLVASVPLVAATNRAIHR